MAKLTALSARTLSKPGRHGDGDGLYLNIAPSGSKSWVQRIVIHGRRRDIGLGPYPAVSLARAREIAHDNRTAVAQGRDPVAEKREAREAGLRRARSIPTFAEAAARVIELRRPTWSNARHAAQWENTLAAYAHPVIGNKTVDSITPADAMAVLTPIWTTKPETASRVRQRMETVMDWAITHGYRLDNPAGRSLLKVLPPVKRLKEHRQALPYAQVPGAVALVRECTADIPTKLAFEFLVLTAGRSVEVREAEWSEIDWEAATWEIPAARMKARRPHRVPLSTGAATILWQAWELTGGRGLIFPSTRSGKPASEMVFTSLLRRLEIPAVPHGFRTSFRNWVAECTAVPWAVAEAALAHNVGNSTEGAYMRSDLFQQRRTLMQVWSDHITSGIDMEGAVIEQSPDSRKGLEAAYPRRHPFEQSRELTEAQAAYVAGWTDAEGKPPEQFLADYLRDVLNDKIPEIPKFTDLPSLWREAPEASLDSNHSVLPDRWTLLRNYIDTAKTERWAWDALYSLLSEMMENGEPVHELLGVWGLYQFTKGGRPRKRGRPQELDRDLRVLAVFRFLRRHGWTRQGAFDYIADLTDYSPDNIRSIVIKLEKRLPSREKNQPNFSP